MWTYKSLLRQFYGVSEDFESFFEWFATMTSKKSSKISFRWISFCVTRMILWLISGHVSIFAWINTRFYCFNLMGIITVDLCPLQPMFSKPLLSFLTPASFKSGNYGKGMTFHRVNCGKIFILWRNNCPQWLHLSLFCHFKAFFYRISSMLIKPTIWPRFHKLSELIGCQ